MELCTSPYYDVFRSYHLNCGQHLPLALCLARFSVAGDGVSLRGPDTDPGGNEMSVDSAEYFTLLLL